MKLIEKAVEKAIESSPHVKSLFDLIKQAVSVLNVVTHSQVTVSNATIQISEAYDRVNAEHDALIEEHHMLVSKYNELAARWDEQQATNAELYSLLLKLANAMKDKGMDPKFPKMEFENVTSGPKKPTSGGTN